MFEAQTPLVIVGAGGHAREIHQLVSDINCVRPAWKVIGFAVDSEFLGKNYVHGLPLFDISDLKTKYRSTQLIIGVGAPALRRRFAMELSDLGMGRFATLVHPRAIVGQRVELGEGCVVFPGSVLTTDIQVGRHVHVNTSASVSHDCNIADYVTLGPHACCCGGVLIGKEVEIGAGAVLIPRVEVGSYSVVGAGAVVTQSLPANVTAAGVPARVLNSRPCEIHPFAHTADV